jgi:ATP-dependent Lhr-like helicase
MASGAVIWVGAGALGPRDGRVVLCRRERAPLLLDPPAERPSGPLHDKIRAHLAARGASFFSDLLQGTAEGGTPAFVPDLVSALWDLVWAGLVTNDTLQPLRALLGPRRAPRVASPPSTPRSPRWRTRAACVAAISWPAAAPPSSR